MVEVNEHIIPGTIADAHVQYIKAFNGEMFDVTSLSRPDPSWKYTDKAGHVHQWHVDGQPATSYNPTKRYTVPTLVQITDVEPTDECPGQYHYECRECRGNSPVAQR